MKYNMSQTTETLLLALGAPEFFKQFGVLPPLITSENSIRFDLPEQEGKVIRVKLTLQPNQEVRVRTYELVALEDVPNVAQSHVQKVLEHVCGIKAQ